jgi:uncharacterized DUF497 family protein
LAIVSEANWDVDGNALSIRPVPQYVRQSRLYVKAQSMRREFVLADQPTGPTAVNSHYIIGHWEIIPRLSALATACLSGRDTLTFHLCTTKWRFVYTRRYNNLSGHLGVRLGRWQRLHIGRHEITPEEVEEVFDGDYKVRRARQKLYAASGETLDGRLLFVVFRRLPVGMIRVVTAREMDDRDRRVFRRK